MLTIDGSFGEGGGQIVRSALALSLVTGKPLAITNIRAGRKKPGLMRQHLTAVNAAGKVSGAEVQGAAVGSSCLSFAPGEVAPGNYTFSVGTAGSATLVLQTVLPGLLLADAPSTLTLEGGTHNPFAPPFDFLAQAFLPLVCRMGAHVEANLERLGFYPAGGGRFTVRIVPAERLQGFELLERGAIVSRRVRAMVANLPEHIAKRECDTIARKSGWPKSCFRVERAAGAPGPGNVVFVEIESQHVTDVFTGFGQKGITAERVAAGAWREAQAYLKAEVPVGPYLADQLFLPLGIAARFGSGSAFRTVALTPHSTTHIEILRAFLDVKIEVEPSGGCCLVRLS